MIVVTAKKGKIRLNARKDCSIGVNAAPPIITRGQRKKFHSASMPLPSPQRLLSDEQTFAESPPKLILFAEGVDVVTGWDFASSADVNVLLSENAGGIRQS